MPEERTLARLIERDDLGPRELDAVSRRLADFHRGADQAPPQSRNLSLLESSLGENIETLEAIGPPALPPDRIRAAGHFTEAFLRERRDQLRARADEGWIRECHGDLRAEHVIVANGVDVYDCVEFDPALRYIDVAADLAFLLMDVARLGSPELADRLVASYRRAGGDRRRRCAALLLCGVSRLGQVEGGVRAGCRAPMRQCRARWAAERSSEAARPRASIRLAVPFAAGGGDLRRCGQREERSASRVEATSGLRHLNSDVTRKRLAGVPPTKSASAEHYGEEFNRRTYEELGRLAAEEIERNGGAIVDATFRRPPDREAFATGLGSTPVPVFFAQCMAPAEILLERAQAREGEPGAVSDAGPAIVEHQLSELEPLHEVPGHLRAGFAPTGPSRR